MKLFYIQIGSGDLEHTWAGGIDGMEVTNRLLPEVTNLLSKKGIFYLVTIRQNKPGLFEKIYRYM